MHICAYMWNNNNHIDTMASEAVKHIEYSYSTVTDIVCSCMRDQGLLIKYSIYRCSNDYKITRQKFI